MGPLFIFSAFLLITLGACSKPERVSREVAGYRFDIPNQYIVDATIAFLPASQNDGVRFVTNPSAPLPEQNMVSIDPTASCPAVDPSRPKDPDCKVTPLTIEGLEKAQLRRSGDAVWWDYKTAAGSKLVAFCSAVEGDGLCTHHGLYKRLPYALHLRDSQMPHLIALRRSTERLLGQWQVSDK